MQDMQTNNDYLNDIAGMPHASGKSNNELLKIIAEEGAGGGAIYEINSIKEKNEQQDLSIGELGSRIDGASATINTLSSRVGELEDNYLDYAPTIADIQSKDIDQDTAISLATSKNEAQDLRLDDLDDEVSGHESRVTALESTITDKADLVSGKIPLSQLPDLPVGRKVSVADSTERLALAAHADLTIAYQVDTGDAWVLNAGEDPSDPDNWDVLGNADPSGVHSFNGRTGNVVPQSGDYTAAMITTNEDRAFISSNDRNRWDDKATPIDVEVSVSGLRSEVEAGYIKTSSRAQINGVATLGSDGKVPTAQLPPLGLTAIQSERLDQIESTANLANAKGDSAASNILAVDNRLTQVDNDSKARDDTKASISALNAKQDSLVSGTNIKTVGGTSVLGSGNIPLSGLMSRTTSNNVIISQYEDRTEYQSLITFSVSVPTGVNRYQTLISNRMLPVGVTFDTSDEHYISAKCNDRALAINVWDNSSRYVCLGFNNTWEGTVNATGSVFFKLVRYK